MKVKNSLRSLKQRHRDCRVVRRKGRVYVINKTNPKSGQIGGPSRADRGAVITPPPVVCSYQGPSPWRRGVSRVGLAILVVLEARNGGWCSGPVLL